MVQAAVLRLSSTERRLPFQAIEAFPTSLSVIHLAGLHTQLDSEAVAKLTEIEKQLHSRVRIAPILQARTERDMEEALTEAFEIAADYYAESGIIIWRTLNHNYSKLLQLSRSSCQALETEFFRHAERLQRDTFIKVVTGVRVWSKVGEWVIAAESRKELAEGQPPLEYLFRAVIATFLASCLLDYVTGGVKRARASNLRALAEAIRDTSEETYGAAVQKKLYESADEKQYWYWNPRWQEGEVEADLDRQLGDVKRFTSAEDLVRDLKNPASD